MSAWMTICGPRTPNWACLPSRSHRPVSGRPPIPDDQTSRPNVTGRTSGVEAFWWTIAEFCSRQLLPYAFADAEDERHQYTIVIHQVATRLRLDAVAYGENGAVRLNDDVVTTNEELVDVIVSRLTDDTTRADWAGPVTGVGTINTFIRRLRSSLRTGLAALERAESDARARLSAARDHVVTLGAPALDGTGLLDGWTALATWAVGEARARDQDITAAAGRAAAAQANLNGLTGRLRGDLAAAGIELTPEAAAAGASSAVAGALERARAATKRVVERRAQAADSTPMILRAVEQVQQRAARTT